MKLEKEITVRVNCDYKTLDKALKKQGFRIIEKYDIDDIYLVPANIDLKNKNVLEILTKCVLVRKIGANKKTLTFKHKKYAPNGDILEEAKVDCNISDIKQAVSFMEAIGYKRLLNISDSLVIYSDDNMEFAVQLVNNKYVLIEMEDECYRINKRYDSLESMINDLNKLNIDFDRSNYFVKKAELIFNDEYRNSLEE